MASSARSALPGSESRPTSDAQVVGHVDPTERIEVSVTLRPRQQLPDLDAQLGEQPYLSREQFAAAYGAEAADLARVEDFARQYGLDVVESSAARRTVRLAGRAPDMNAAFGVKLAWFRVADTTFRSYDGPITLPTNLVGVVQGVFGLDTRPVAGRDSR